MQTLPIGARGEPAEARDLYDCLNGSFTYCKEAQAVDRAVQSDSYGPDGSSGPDNDPRVTPRLTYGSFP